MLPRLLPSRRFLLLLPMAAFFLVPSCKKDDFLSKDEKAALFAAPSALELDAVFKDWQQRNLQPTAYSVVQETSVAGGKFTLKIVSFRVNGLLEYGALLIPKTTGTLPVRMLISGFGLNAPVTSFKLVYEASSAPSSFILAIPALRGQSLELTLNDTLYASPVSEGAHCNAFDGATDDTIAFLNLIQQTESRADVNRTSVRGGSRGSTVALLAGIRDERVKGVVGVAGPVNLLALTSQNENDPTYQCQFLSNFKNRSSTLAQARANLMASSPIYFAQHLPLTQLHLGLKDRIVPVGQGKDLEQKMADLGKSALFQLFTYDRTHTDIATNNAELADRIEQFLAPL